MFPIKKLHHNMAHKAEADYGLTSN